MKLYKKLGDKRIITLENNFEKCLTLWKSVCDIFFFKCIEQNFFNVKVILNKIRIVDKYMKNDCSIYIDDGKNKVEILNRLINLLEEYIEDNYNIIVMECTDGDVDENHIW